MTSWYYVQGTERMGPVEEKQLHNIFLSGELKPESFVWTKGFANWAKIHEVDELKYFFEEEKESPEVHFSIDWNNFSYDAEIFYIQVGPERLSMGPYSLKELYGAFLQKRITAETYVYTPGMLYWEKLGAIPKIHSLWKIEENTLNTLETRSPTLVVFDRQPMPVISLVQNISDDGISILCGHHMLEDDDLLVTIYKKEELLAKNFKFKVTAVNQFNQTINCDLTKLTNEQRKILNACRE